MAKKLSKSKKRVTRQSKNNTSVLNSVFGFPKFIIYAFVVLVVLLVYQLSLPSVDVKGASTTSQNGTDNYPKLLYTQIWRDANGNGIKEDNETVCPQKEYKYVANGTERTKTQRPNCGWNTYDLRKNDNNKVTFTTKLKNYTYSGMEYTDKNGFIHRTKSTSITFSGGKYTEFKGNGGWYRNVSFGLKPK